MKRVGAWPKHTSLDRIHRDSRGDRTGDLQQAARQMTKPRCRLRMNPLRSDNSSHGDFASAPVSVREAGRWSPRHMANLKWHRSLLLIGAILGWLQVNADESRDTVSCCCTTVEMTSCLADELKRADDTVTNLYRALMKQLNSPADRARLREAQHAWLTFRDKSCVYEVGPSDRTAGTVSPLEQTGCLAKYTKQRAEQLQDYVTRCEQHGC